MKIKVKLNSNAIMPTQATGGSVGFDLYTPYKYQLIIGEPTLVKTGVSLSMPDDYFALVLPRSGLAINQGVVAVTGVIDSDYRGEIGITLFAHSFGDYKRYIIKAGDRVAQLVFLPKPKIELMQVESLDVTDRGDKGFGSTGR